MPIIDLVIIAILVISSLISLSRGFIKEALSLASWIIAGWIAFNFSSNFATLLEGVIAINSVRIAVAAVILFIITVVIGSVLVFIITAMVDKSGLTSTDRSIGMAFGLIRGVLIVVGLIYIANLTPVPEDEWYKQSLLVPHFNTLASHLSVFIPEEVKKYMSFGF
ncbi:MAG: CvpA family protein [Gammaproteobacteria bacterium]|nr:MAG: CvpA family protein [Gammaproteobacteria bacterium]